MQPTVLISIAILWIIVATAVVLYAATRRSQSNGVETTDDKYPQGFFNAVGMSIGIAMGILAGLALGSLSGGIAIGIGIGLIIGPALEKRRKGDVSPLTEQEKQERLNRTALGYIAFGILVLVTLVLAVLLLLK